MAIRELQKVEILELLNKMMYLIIFIGLILITTFGWFAILHTKNNNNKLNNTQTENKEVVESDFIVIRRQMLTNDAVSFVTSEEIGIEHERRFLNLFTDVESDEDFNEIISSCGGVIYDEIIKKIPRHKIEAINRRFENLGLICRLKYG